ncbi:MAG TPA: hypothetical protein O0W86_00330 [Methanocorpusculum sp.]|nr:hypothetical protein [Methanocorpusculum sp.]
MYGIIDIGSNTIRLVLYDVQDGRIRPMLNKKITAGLAGYVKKGRMTEKGIKKLIEVLTEFSEILPYIQIKEIFCLATASLRNIENTDEVCTAVKIQCGFDIIVLSGEEEALYDYYGAMQSVNEPAGVVIDIGGGSTEFVFYMENSISKILSIPIGSLTAYSAYVKDIIPTAKERKEIESAMESAMSEIFEKSPDVICGVGGSIRAAVKVYNEIFPTLPKGRVQISSLASLLKVRKDILAKAILKTAPERIHTFVPGLVLLCTIARKWNIKELTVSTSGVKEGFLTEKLNERGVL